MKREFRIVAAVGLVVAFGLNAGSAAAASSRTFVSGQGTDTGTCSVTSPCRSFSYAITQTAAGGEIVVLTSAGYGAFTINHAISITNEEGVEAAITVASGDGITIAAGASDVVNLTGLTLTGNGGTNGITFTSGGELHLQNCVIRGFSNIGLNLSPAASTDFSASDTIVSDNGNSGVSLSQPNNTNPTITAAFERVQATGNGADGFLVYNASPTAAIHVTAADSLAAHNGGAGFSTTSFIGVFTVTSSTAVNNQIGIYSNFGGTLVLAGSTISGNSEYGYQASGDGIIDSFGNNNITDTTNSGTLTKVGQQ